MADVQVKMVWTGTGLEFDGGSLSGPQVRFDGNGLTGPSPVQTLLLAAGGCMAADIVDIATKSRVAMAGLDVELEGNRAADYPRRYTSMVMRFRASGVAAEDEEKLQRAMDLSREKYCSVLHTLRQDVDFQFRLELV